MTDKDWKTAERVLPHDDLRNYDYWEDAVSIVAAALSSAREDGARQMREMAATKTDYRRDNGLNADLQSEPILWCDGYKHGCRDVAADIRALPLTENKP